MVQPLAPDGHYELIPLFFARLDRRDHASITGALGLVAASGTSASDAAVGAALGAYASGRGEAVKHLVASAERMRALLELEWDDDVDMLSAGSAETSGPICG